MFRQRQLRVAAHELLGAGARFAEYVAILEQIGDLQFGHSRLLRAEELPGTAQAEVGFGDFETVARSDESLEPLFSLRRCRFAEDQAIGLQRAAADAAAQLVERREAEHLG